MPKSYRYLLARLSMEKEKLLGWAHLTRIADGDEATGSAMRLHRHTIIDALREIQILLLDLSQLEKRYKLKLVVASGKAPTGTGSNPPSGKMVRLMDSKGCCGIETEDNLAFAERVLHHPRKGFRFHLKD
jgi:hypothetical protein